MYIAKRQGSGVAPVIEQLEVRQLLSAAVDAALLQAVSIHRPHAHHSALQMPAVARHRRAVVSARATRRAAAVQITIPPTSAPTTPAAPVTAGSSDLASPPPAAAQPAASPALVSEGTVEVDLRAASLPNGTVTSIQNLGSSGGTFDSVSGAITVGPITDANALTYKAFQFNGANAASSSFTAPADLTGNSTRSIELWVNNPTIDTIEETMVSWSHRGGPDGSNESFSYGSAYGVGQWGAPYDLQWTNTAPGVTGTGAPAANAWHYMVFTYDGTNNNVYVDGTLYLQAAVPGPLATVAGLPINLAAQNTAGATGFNPALLGSLDLASVRVENGALTPADVQNNYVVGVPGRPPATTAPTTAPTLNPLPTNGQLTLTWSYDPNAFSYNVYRTDASHPTPLAIATNLAQQTFTDTTAAAGVTYTYYVTSVNNIGQGPASNKQSGSIVALTTAPTLNPAQAGNSSVNLSWSADSHATSYRVYRSDPVNTTPVAIATGLVTLTYLDTTVTNGTPYTYFVVSVNSVGQGPHSNSVTATPAVPPPFGPVNILTHHGNYNNDGLNASESVLTPANVNPTDFGKQFSMSLDGGDVIAEPLYMQNVTITSGANQGVHSVVFVATQADGLYALDANTGATLWHDNFTNVTSPGTLTPTTGVTTILQADINGNPDVGAQLGILATPAIDPSTGIMYLNANTKELRADGKHFVQRLWAIDIKSGLPTMSPAIIGDTIAPNGLTPPGPFTYVAGAIINGTGNNNPAGKPTPTYPNTDGWTAAPGGASGYVLAFNAIQQMERTAVSLINGSVYLGFASHGDNGPYYGWVLGYKASNLALNAAFVTTPTYEPTSAVGASTPYNNLGGVWMSGSNISTDGTNLYLVTGNGAFNGAPSNFDANGFPIDHDYGDTVLKLTPDNSTTATQNGNGWGLKVSDYFTPSNAFELNDLDLDLGSGGATLLPNNILDKAGIPMLMVGGKESRIYLIDRNNMGKFNFSYPTGVTNVDPAPYDRVVGEYANAGINNGSKQIYSSATYYNGNIYMGVKGTPAVELNLATMVATGTATPVKTNLNFGYPGETFTMSADATSSGVAWALNPGGSDLVAYDAANFTNTIYDSNTNAGDGLGGSIHFHVPMQANGMVYAGSRGGSLGGYGLKLSYLNSNPNFFSAPSGLTAVPVSDNDAHLKWTSNSSLATEFRIDRAPHGTSAWTTVAYVGNSSTTYDDTAISTHTTYDYRVVAISAGNSTTPSATAVLGNLLPPYITASTDAAYTFDKTTGALVLTHGTLTFTQDQATSGDTVDPLVNLTASNAGTAVLFQTSQHLAGLTLTGGAIATETSVGAARSATNHDVLVIGAPNQASAPPFSIDAQSKLNLVDNDLVVHQADLPSALALWTTGRNGGTWNGNGLTSSYAQALDANVHYEQNALGYGQNKVLLNAQGQQLALWNVGAFTEPLSTNGNDLIFKTTYVADFNLDGKVDSKDVGIIGGYYDAGASTGNLWTSGDTDGNGRINSSDIGNLGGLYLNGTPASGLPPL